jgi:hypothetical protein
VIEPGEVRVTIEQMIFGATRQRREPVNEEANRVLIELEQEFDLLRLRARRVSLEQEATRLAEEQESLRNDLGPPAAAPPGPSASSLKSPWMRGLWRAVTKRVVIWQLELRRAGLADEARRLVILEEDIKFAMRLGRR